MREPESLRGCIVDYSDALTRKGKTCVYDIFLNGEVVYVGITNSPKKRYSSHRTSGVATEGAKLVVHKWHSTKGQALQAEKSRQIELEPIRCQESYIQARIHRKAMIEALQKSFIEGSQAQYESWAQRWCDPLHVTDEQAFAVMPEHIRKQFKNVQMAGKILGPRKPGSGLGRPKQSTED